MWGCPILANKDLVLLELITYCVTSNFFLLFADLILGVCNPGEENYGVMTLHVLAAGLNTQHVSY